MKTHLSENDFQQMLRIASGATLGFTISKAMDWPNPIFFTLYPILLLGLVAVLNGHIIRQFLAATVFPAMVVLVVYGLFGTHPLLITPLIAATFAFLFWQMSKGTLYLFGAFSLVGLSLQLHFASYSSDGIDIYALVISNIGAILLALIIAFALHIVFPDEAPRTPLPKATKDKASIRHEVILCTTVATLSFAVFQTFDLVDSISAQAASALILFPLCWKGATMSGWQRALGTLIGCNLALLAQLILLNYSDTLFFASFSLWILVFFISRQHVLGGGGAGTGFGVLTTFGILYGQSLSPQQDIIYSALYRFSSVVVAIALSLCVIYVVHRALNTYQATRHHTFY
ncbi:DUF2955 domain-containing protein [Alteromonas sp. S005]|uniref:DUF2955 domain-containing protein n=1 Tax=Alteromonas sp. S005 TaxID=3117400 RepID=UPI002FE0F927